MTPRRSYRCPCCSLQTCLSARDLSVQPAGGSAAFSKHTAALVCLHVRFGSSDVFECTNVNIDNWRRVCMGTSQGTALMHTNLPQHMTVCTAKMRAHTCLQIELNDSWMADSVDKGNLLRFANHLYILMYCFFGVDGLMHAFLRRAARPPRCALPTTYIYEHY